MLKFTEWMEQRQAPRAWFISPTGEVYGGYNHEEIAEEQLNTSPMLLRTQNWASISTFSNGRAAFQQNFISEPALKQAQAIFQKLQLTPIEVFNKNGYKDIPLEVFLSANAAQFRGVL